MSATDTPMPPDRKPPLCPKCNSPMVLKGRVKDVGFFKKWVEDWHCEYHGFVEQPAQKSRERDLRSSM